MGYALIPTIGIAVAPVDRQAGPSAGPGASGNRCIYFGANSGFNCSPNDTIAIGNNALGGGMTDITNWNGGVIIGSSAAAAAQSCGTAFGVPGGMVVIGYNALPLNVRGNSSVIIGNRALLNALAIGNSTPLANNVVIGHEAAYQVTLNNAGVRAGDYTNNVVVGYRAGNVPPTNSGINQSVCIGSGALSVVGGTEIYGMVCIGYNAGVNYNGNGVGNSNCVIIGQGAGPSQTNANQVIIGGTANSTQTGNTSDCVAIGYTAQSALFNVALGSNASASPGVAGGAAPSVVIGYTSGSGTGIGRGVTFLGGNINSTNAQNRSILIGCGNKGFAADDIFLVETFDSATRRTALIADMNAGNVILGKSTTGTDRDFNGTNTLKLINGTVGGNPVGGGYFYVSAGALHWKGSAGTDTTIAPA